MSATEHVAKPVLEQRVGDRLTVLRHELHLGESRLREIEREQALLQQTVLRISGAIQVLEELQQEHDGSAAADQ